MDSLKTFAGIPEGNAKLGTAKIVLIPVPYDGTSTWGKGADKGPQAFLEAADHLELYDIETDTQVYEQGIYLANAVTKGDTPEAMVLAVQQTVQEYLSRNKFVTLFGGEHSISIGAIRAMANTFHNLTVVQIDAHADLRKTYMGSPYNHACALHEANETTNLVQVGIRSMDASELDFMNEENVFFAHDMAKDDYWMDNALELMTDQVYITFDLDALDPSILPATGTPEPGGLLWYETLEFLRKIFSERNVVGFDIVELCPEGHGKSSAFTAAKLYYKMLSYQFEEDLKNDGELPMEEFEEPRKPSNTSDSDDYEY